MCESNVFIVGPVRTGTTWLYDMLKENTDCSYIPGKEIYFYDRSYKGKGKYLSEFKRRGKVLVDVSPTYFSSDDARNRIKRDFPDAKIVVVKKSPVAIIVSQYIYLKRNGLVSVSFSEFMERPEYYEYRERVKYSHFLPKWEAEFGAERVIVMDYEDFKKDPLKYFDSMCRKIDLAASKDINDVGVSNSGAGQPRLRFLYRLLVNIGRAGQSFLGRERLLAVRAYIEKILINKKDRVALEKKEILVAEDYYAEDIDFLQKYLKKVRFS